MNDEQTNGMASEAKGNKRTRSHRLTDERDNGASERYPPPEHMTDAQQADHRDRLEEALYSVEDSLTRVECLVADDRDLSTTTTDFLYAVCEICGEIIELGRNRIGS